MRSCGLSLTNAQLPRAFAVDIKQVYKDDYSEQETNENQEGQETTQSDLNDIDKTEEKNGPIKTP
jgi:hypothetical protein